MSSDLSARLRKIFHSPSSTFFSFGHNFFQLKYTASLTFLFSHWDVLFFKMQVILLSSVKTTELNFRGYECSLPDAEHINNRSETETLQ